MQLKAVISELDIYLFIISDNHWGFFDPDDEELMNILLKGGGDPSIKTKDGYTARDFARKSLRMMNLIDSFKSSEWIAFDTFNRVLHL